MSPAEVDAELAADPAFVTVCDERADRALEDHLSATEWPSPLPWELAWCGDRDGDDAAPATGLVSL